MRSVELLCQLADDGGAGRIGQQRQLAQVLTGCAAVRRSLERRADEDRPLALGR